MKVAPKVILLFDDADGLGSAFYGALQPNLGSNLKILNNSFELSLERYGVKDRKASGQILHFLNANGLYEVSILLLQNYEPPILACALNEVLMSLAGVDFSTMPTLVVPFVVPESKLKLENRYLVTSEEYSVYGIKLGPTTDVTQDLSSTLQKPPPSMKINHENLACLLHLANVIKLPTLVLIGRSSQHLLHKTNKEELEQVSRFMQTPRHLHLDTVRRIIRYLRGTPSRGLFFPVRTPRLNAYGDADWAKCPDTQRSITGWCMFLGDSLISWKSIK